MKSKFFVFLILTVFCLDIKSLPVPCENSQTERMIFVLEENECPPGYFLSKKKWEKVKSTDISKETFSILKNRFNLADILDNLDQPFSQFYNNRKMRGDYEPFLKNSIIENADYLRAYGFRNPNYISGEFYLVSPTFNKVVALGTFRPVKKYVTTDTQKSLSESDMYGLSFKDHQSYILSEESYGLSFSIAEDELNYLKKNSKYLEKPKNTFLSEVIENPTYYELTKDLYIIDEITSDSLAYYIGHLTNLNGEKLLLYLDEMELIQDGTSLHYVYLVVTFEENIIEEKFFDNTDKRAMIIAASNYTKNPIPQSLNDAIDFSNLLTDKNFNVTNSINEDIDQINDKIYQFLNNKENNKLNENNNLPPNIENEAIFYFSGHGLSVNGENFLLPHNIKKIDSLQELRANALSLNKIVNQISAAYNGPKLFIIDSCRNSYLDLKDDLLEFNFDSNNLITVETKTLTESINIDDYSLSFAPIKADKNTILIYSSAPGTVSLFNSNKRRSYFTDAFIKTIEDDPSLSLNEILRITRQKLDVETYGNQISWESSSLINDYFFPFSISNNEYIK